MLVKDYEDQVQVICEDHVAAAESHIQDPALRAALVDEVRAECNEIIEYRHVVERFHLEIDSRTKDRIISFGEKLSCRFVTSLLRDRVRLDRRDCLDRSDLLPGR